MEEHVQKYYTRHVLFYFVVVAVVVAHCMMRFLLGFMKKKFTRSEPNLLDMG